MARKPITMNGMSAAGIQAPSVNFDTSTISAMNAVVTAPMVLMAIPHCQRGSRCRRWWRTMPDWLRVKPVNTPTAYSGMSWEMSPWKATISADAATARNNTPFENTSRVPRLKNCRGRKPSLAMIEARRGKSA
jgi:hypothetical protein